MLGLLQVERDQLVASRARLKRDLKSHKEGKHLAELAKIQAEKSVLSDKERKERRDVEKSLLAVKKDLERLPELIRKHSMVSIHSSPNLSP